MKTMTCKQLGGACDFEFQANTFEEVGALSKSHGIEMHQKQDAAHMEAMQKMGELMKNPADMAQWLESRRIEFEAFPDN